MDDEGYKTPCEHVNDGSARILPRKVTLFKLNHEIFSAVLNDWVYPKCGYENLYTVNVHSIYPTTNNRAFTGGLL